MNSYSGFRRFSVPVFSNSNDILLLFFFLFSETSEVLQYTASEVDSLERVSDRGQHPLLGRRLCSNRLDLSLCHKEIRLKQAKRSTVMLRESRD